MSIRPYVYFCFGYYADELPDTFWQAALRLSKEHYDILQNFGITEFEDELEHFCSRNYLQLETIFLDECPRYVIGYCKEWSDRIFPEEFSFVLKPSKIRDDKEYLRSIFPFEPSILVGCYYC